MKSTLVKNQVKEIKFLNKDLDGHKVDMITKLRYDDNCNNGHNSFSITAAIYKAGCRNDYNMIMCGCCHDEIKKIAPELNKYIKYHLMNSDSPMYYIDNTIYHASNVKDYHYFVYLEDKENGIEKNLLGLFDNKEQVKKIKKAYSFASITVKEKETYKCHKADLEAARRSAIAPTATLKQLQDKDWLKARLPMIRQDFKKAMEELGFIY